MTIAISLAIIALVACIATFIRFKPRTKREAAPPQDQVGYSQVTQQAQAAPYPTHQQSAYQLPSSYRQGAYQPVQQQDEVQRPRAFVLVLGIVMICLLGPLALIGLPALFFAGGDYMMWVVLSAFGLLGILSGVLAIYAYKKSFFIDSTELVRSLDQYGRRRQMRVDEIVKFYIDQRQFIIVSRDGVKLKINMAWFRMPLLCTALLERIHSGSFSVAPESVESESQILWDAGRLYKHQATLHMNQQQHGQPQYGQQHGQPQYGQQYGQQQWPGQRPTNY